MIDEGTLAAAQDHLVQDPGLKVVLTIIQIMKLQKLMKNTLNKLPSLFRVFLGLRMSTFDPIRPKTKIPRYYLPHFRDSILFLISTFKQCVG